MTDGGEWAGSESKEWKDGRHKRENRSVYPHAGEIGDRQTRRALTAARSAYDRIARHDDLPADAPPMFEETTLARSWRYAQGSETFARAVEKGDAIRIRHFVGAQDTDVDLSGMKALQRLRDIVTRPAFMAYMWAEPGTGKTNFAFLLAQLWKRHHPDGEVGTNVRTLEQKDEWCRNYGDLDRWMKADEDAALRGEATPKLFIFDEASSNASGRGKDGYETAQKLGVLAYKIRKYGGSLIIIGHDGGDVHPAIRELAIAINKETKKRATVYESVRNRKGERPIVELSGIPPTDWQYNDKEATTWSWDRHADSEETSDESLEEAHKDIAVWTAIKAKEQGLSNREAAEVAGYSREWVRLRYEEYKDGGKAAETFANVEAVIA
ncbi:hypothetical protein GJ631_14975 [Natronomonas sp. CBA1123]|uniref:ATP-binding protein n=1 Tax=Natronomonas sp. CBA1123 TaxID=2668070 RepID=UPI0012EA27C2|nr:ATP-binding protein [Natronomonas sp. CBA1123]MUV87818.1 hypothetical protein [Natronomonas sp. CBA1123]